MRKELKQKLTTATTQCMTMRGTNLSCQQAASKINFGTRSLSIVPINALPVAQVKREKINLQAELQEETKTRRKEEVNTDDEK